MVHFCLTNQCNRRCNHCVEAGWFLADATRPVQNMHPNVFSRVLRMFPDKIADGTVILCGGEVLLYPHLENILSIADEYECRVDVSTNLCVDTHIVQNIVRNYNDVIRLWYVRIDYEESEKEHFFRNFFDYVVNIKPFILLVTMTKDEDSLKRNIQRVNEVLSRFAAETKPNIMLSFAMPVPGRRFEVYNYTSDVIRLIEEVRKENGPVVFNIEQTLSDCELSYDLINDKDKIVFLKGDFLCEMDDLYILPNRMVVKCLSCPSIMVPDVFCFSDVMELNNVFSENKAKTYKSTMFPQFCRSCSELNPGKCLGFCLAKRGILQ